jgi:phage-related protein
VPRHAGITIPYKYLYTQGLASVNFVVVTDSSPPDVVFVGDSLNVIRGFPDDARAQLGADLRRVLMGERPLDSGSMAAALPGVFELRDEDRDFWYRVLYVKLEGVVHVLHCFRKKTNETPQKDINAARFRLSALRQRITERKQSKKKYGGGGTSRSDDR